MMKKYSIAFVAFVLSLFAGIVAAATPAEQLTSLLGNLKSMQATFNQTIYDGNGGVMQHSAGSMALERPGRFRWEIKTPNEQVIIADGEEIWNYDPGLQQAVEQPMGNSLGDTPAFLLTGSTDSIAKSFNIAQIPQHKAGQTAFKLTPKDQGALFQWVQLVFSNNQLTEMELQDNLGQQTMINFTDVKFNPSLNPTLFQFTPPKGVDVIRQQG